MNTEFRIFHNNRVICNTTSCMQNVFQRHGLFIVQNEEPFQREYLYLSSMDEKLFTNDYDYELSSHYYNGRRKPCGEGLISYKRMQPYPKIIYEMGPISLTKEIIPVQEQEQLLIKYSLNEGPDNINLHLKPLMPVRPLNRLRHASGIFKINDKKIKCGREFNFAYQDHQLSKPLFIQFSGAPAYNAQPQWHYNIQYQNSLGNKLPVKEDIYSPGIFKVSLNKEQPVIVSISAKEIYPEILHTLFAHNEILSKNMSHVLVN